MYDLLIIGGGPAGYVAAERAGSNGLKVALFEKKTLGGVCLNEGCIPTKTMLYSAKLFENATHANLYGISVENASINYGKVVDRKDKTVRKLVAGVKTKMKTNNVNVVIGDAMIVNAKTNNVEIVCNGEKFSGKNLLICTGSSAAIPPIPGLKGAGDIILTNKEILELKEIPKSLVIIGGGVIGMEFASLFNSLGSKVTVIEMMPEILGANDFEISEMLRNAYTKKGVDFHLNSKVIRIDKNKVFVEKDGKESIFEGEKILISVGRKPNVTGFGLEKIGVELLKGGIKVNAKMETNVSSVFAAGDVTGFSLLAHTASREGEVVVNNLLGKKDTMSYQAIPGVVYTNPEVAGVGETEEGAKAKGLNFRVMKLPMAYSGRFMAENEGGSGLCKLIVGEKHNEILGVHLLGNPASEIIYGACIAIEQEMTLTEFQRTVFPHPTVSEIIKETVFI